MLRDGKYLRRRLKMRRQQYVFYRGGGHLNIGLKN